MGLTVHLHHPGSGTWDWRSAGAPAQVYHADLARRLARWGHRVSSFTAAEYGIGPDGERWLPAAALNPAVPDVWVIFTADDPLPGLRNVRQLRWLIDPTTAGPVVPDEFDRLVAIRNADMYTAIGGSVVSLFNGHPYRHPNHFTYAHPWERDSRDRALTVTRDQVFLDVGASIGSWALPAAAAGARVYAFDPGTDATALRRLAAENGFGDRVRVDGRLVAEASGRPVARADVPWHSVPPEAVLGDTTTVSIDDFVAEAGLDRVDLVKVDTDGGELAVIAGMAGTLLRFRPKVVIETHTFLGVSVADVTRALGGSGYTCTAAPMEEAYYFHVYGTPDD